MADSLVVPRAGQRATSEREVKRSRFIAWAARAETEPEARDLVAAARGAFPDARHHCSAFVYRAGDPGQVVERSSDDGEPSGTAGAPILDIIRGSGVVNVAVVVTRYFGGVKLGTGGLVSAYSDAARAAMGELELVTRTKMAVGQVDLQHEEAGRVESELRRGNVTVVGVDYGRLARYTLAFAPDELEHVDALVSASTRGRSRLRHTGYTWIDVQPGRLHG
ncbi:IMPACT family member YigZ [Corynebacterium capitovis DSM 44611]|uniref:IMPACT family protein n=1 Tax=Corynebacterium capitovis TaxID=131081 RepID=UPI00037232DB|nr:YigZ family protein [Corynebacterium capitovis]WKD57391.1 IMPACT family member YigZ [Corynebacterium capitovis DSM 44611]